MAKLVKGIPQQNGLPVQKEQVNQSLAGFNVEARRVMNREETYLPIKGAFKIKVKNEGDVDVIIFGSYSLPSYSEETFEQNDANLTFKDDTAIKYPEYTEGENVNILLIKYFK